MFQSLFDIINIPLSYVLKFLSDLFGGNFAVSVFVFTLLINLVLLPLSIKSQKSMVQQTRIKPKLDELKKRYGDDQQKFAEAQRKLYQEENVSMSGGCLPMLVRLVLLMSIYWLLLSPLTYMAGAEKTKVNNVADAISSGFLELKESDKEQYEHLTKEYGWKATSGKTRVNNQLALIRILRDDPDFVKEIVPAKEYKAIQKDFEDVLKKEETANLKFTLFNIKSLDLTQTPAFNIDIFHHFQILWLLPICAFLAQMLTSVISMMIQKKNNPEAPTMAGMLLMMPLISLFIGFGFPGGVCFYWICSSLIGGVIQSAIQILYGPHAMLARERAKQIGKRLDFESKMMQKSGSSDDAAGNN